MPESVTLTVGGRTMIIETGELAKQANGSALVRYGDQNVVLCAVTASEKPREGIDFFPLTCDFEEKMYAAGKIPGGYIKREGRPPEHAVISSRQIDRPIRPLFPDGFRNDIQVVATVLSIDPELDADVLGVCAAGAALALSDIPFGKTVAAVRVGRDERRRTTSAIPTLPQYETGGMDIVIAGTADAVMMVEGGGNEITEDDFLGAVEFAHGEIRAIVKAIDELARKAARRSASIRVFEGGPGRSTSWVRKTFAKDVAKAMRTVEKQKREDAFAAMTVDEAIARCGKKDEDVGRCSKIRRATKSSIRSSRPWKRTSCARWSSTRRSVPTAAKPDEIRPIWSKVHYVPRVHGSGVFTRGQTQVFTAATLGSTSDAQRLDGIMALEDKRYMHFYNFPPYSVGETRPMRGPGRREIGHGCSRRTRAPAGASAEGRVSVHAAPDERSARIERLLVDGVGLRLDARADGCRRADSGARRRRRDGPDSQRRASTRSSPTSKASKMRSARWTSKSREPRRASPRFRWTSRSRASRSQIMREAMAAGAASRVTSSSTSSPKRSPHRASELSQFAPRMIVVKIDPAKIKDVIGPGGKVINKIIADTGVEKIDIEDDGSVFITSLDGASGDKAKQIVENLTKEVVVGETYLGTVTRIITIGAFVQILPGKEGLVHISQLAPTRVEKVEDVVKLGDEIMVKVMEIDGQGRINLSRKAVLTGGVSGNGDYGSVARDRVRPRRAARDAGRRLRERPRATRRGARVRRRRAGGDGRRAPRRREDRRSR